MAYTMEILSKCVTCGRNFKGRVGQRHCSSSCRNIWGRFSKVTRPFKPAIYGKCKKCGCEYLKGQKNQVYCSPKCQLAVKYLKRKKRNRNKNFIKKIGFCEACGNSMIMALEAHHYDKNGLIALCGSCHNIWHKTSNKKYAAKDFVIKFIAEQLFKHRRNHAPFNSFSYSNNGRNGSFQHRKV